MHCSVPVFLRLVFLDSGFTGRIFEVARKVTRNIAFYVPRNVNIDQVRTSVLSTLSVITYIVCTYVWATIGLQLDSHSGLRF